MRDAAWRVNEGSDMRTLLRTCAATQGVAPGLAYLWLPARLVHGLPDHHGTGNWDACLACVSMRSARCGALRTTRGPLRTMWPMQVGQLGAADMSAFTLARTFYHITGLSL